MCGIVGIITKKQYGFDGFDIDWFKQLLVADSLRGVDGTGIFCARNDKSVEWGKVASHPYRLLSDPDVQPIFHNAMRSGKVLVGHNRKATVGHVVNANAHPFVKDHIALVHNGRVANAREIAETDVDSEALVHLLTQEDDVPKALGTVWGDFALAWYNSKSHHLYLVRNEARPLWFAESTTGYAFASERWMLVGTFLRTFPESDKLYEPRMLKPNELLMVNCKTLEQTSMEVNLSTVKKQAGVRPDDSERYRAWWEANQAAATVVTTQASAISTASPHGTTTEAAVQVETKPTLPARTHPIGTILTCKTLVLEPRAIPDPARAGQNKNKYYIAGRDETDESMVRGWLPDGTDIDAVNAIIDAKGFTCRVKAPVLKGSMVLAYWVDTVKPKEKPVTIKTYNGNLFEIGQWKRICSDHKCVTCNGSLDPKWPKYTSVQIHNGMDKPPRIICPECIAKKFKEWPEKTQEHIVRSTGYSPLDYLVDKSIDAGVATCH